MAYEYEESIKNLMVSAKGIFWTNIDTHKHANKELQEAYRKARAFDNYLVDLAKTMETFPHNYIKSDNFAKETCEFYMQSKEDFIKAYENETGRKHELIRDAEEYDRILSNLEDKQND